MIETACVKQPPCEKNGTKMKREKGGKTEKKKKGRKEKRETAGEKSGKIPQNHANSCELVGFGSV